MSVYCCEHYRCPGGRLCCCLTESSEAFQSAWHEVHGHRCAGFDEDIALVFSHAMRAARAEAWDECATEARELDLVDGAGRNWLYDRNPYREVGE